MKKPFERVVTEHAEAVLRVCRAVVGVDDADDAWSETFLAAMRAYPELPADANVEAWLVTIAHRKAIDLTRGRARRAVPVGEVPEHPSSIGLPDRSDPDLWRAVGALPERQRLAVAYHHFAGVPYKDVARIVGGTPESVRRAASDGVRTLRNALSDAHPAHPAQRPSPPGRAASEPTVKPAANARPNAKEGTP
ncbi:RNA polymerase sigma factor [Streptomyces tsukubensis]|uniref:RNA polymerase subunit sigma n=1 Tax=Streptomyces tsukubensis TaxID=83656 RepID=A0A1V4AA86_9ACTN|nr:sigma-70 family RNA polymerase sigma factor [Streptomyces tsukubensis]OON80029.1 RNA polymerase subunit sigma [Streptomyces tsukubensis]QFR97261.1 sigma-70 family RNA polymerase sigma factor [Streptomyces tsukubensis]